MTAQHSDLLTVIARRADIDREHAESTLRATLRALAGCVDTAKTHQLMSVLAPAVADLDLPERHTDEPADLSGFLQAVAERDQLDPENVERRVWAVVAALEAQPATRDAIRTVLAGGGQLYQQLLPTPGPLRTETGLTDALSVRAGLDTQQSRSALGATLAALGRELSAGEAQDVCQWLPGVLADQFVPQGSDAEGVSRVDFLRDIATRRGVNTEIARDEARAVLGLLRESVPEPEINKMASQLPDPVGELFR